MTDFPDSPEAVTAEWLSGALERDVAAIEVLDKHAGTTGRLRLALTYGPGSEGPASVFVKLPPFDEAQQGLVAATDMGRKEARFYAGPGQEAPMRIPGCLYAAHGERTEYVMVLEDLQASGCRFTSRAESGAAEHGQQVVEALARLHARFWDDARFDDELSWLRPAMRGPLGAQLIGNALEQFEHDFPPVFGELCRLYIEHHERICELWDEGEQTLIHGDTHAGNQFVDGDQVGFYDWAVISKSPGIRDVAIYLGNSCPTEVRRAHQEEWLEAYLEVLRRAGVDAPSYETLWERYRRTVLYAWIAATTTASMGSRWQPIEIGMAGMTVSTQTCADLDTVGALRDAL